MIKKATILIFILIILSLSYNLFRQLSLTVGSSDKLNQILEDVQDLEIKNKTLKHKLEQIKSAEFIEEQARNKLGLGKQGETVIIISEDKINQILGASQSAQGKRLPNWQGWWKLFFN